MSAGAYRSHVVFGIVYLHERYRNSAETNGARGSGGSGASLVEVEEAAREVLNQRVMPEPKTW